MPRQIGSNDLVARGESVELAIPETPVCQAAMDEYQGRFSHPDC